MRTQLEYKIRTKAASFLLIIGTGSRTVRPARHVDKKKISGQLEAEDHHISGLLFLSYLGGSIIILWPSGK